MEVTFFRHGESEHNIAFEKVGESAYHDPSLIFSSLTKKGRVQALRKSFGLDIKNFQAVITSSLPRALQTTNILFDTSETTVLVSDIVRENNLEHVCNSRKNASEIKAKYSEFDISCLSEIDNLEGDHNKLENRIKALKRILKSLFDDNIRKIAIVSHNDFIKEFLGINYDISHCGRIDILYH